MHTPYLLRTGLMAAVLLSFSLPAELLAQQMPEILRIRRLEADTVRAPQYTTRGGPAAQQRQRQWLEIKTEFQTSRDGPEWFNELTFTYYVAMRNNNPAEGDRPLNVFSGESKYINVAQNQRGQSAVYLHPSTLDRYGEFFRAAVVISFQGRMIAVEHTPSAAAADGRWWEQVSPQPGLVLPRRHTPFAMINFDDFEATPLPER